MSSSNRLQVVGVFGLGFLHEHRHPDRWIVGAKALDDLIHQGDTNVIRGQDRNEIGQVLIRVIRREIEASPHRFPATTDQEFVFFRIELAQPSAFFKIVVASTVFSGRLF
ncbi:hypothetical protein, partial [Pseudomonas aeruginosa]|uniref:hypothetical protein n=1 Tax=Pseudomonas aeruginosa TaxID=287 RepID=UPI003BF4B86F